MKDYYKILGVHPRANEAQIKQAFRALSKKYHPDLNPGDEEAAEKFKDINEANQTLSDPAKRARYDADVKLAREMAGQARPASPYAGGGSPQSNAAAMQYRPAAPNPAAYAPAYRQAPPMSPKKKAVITAVSVIMTLAILAVILVVVLVPKGSGGPVAYTISKVGYGEQIVEKNGQNYGFGAPTKDGMTFLGWALDAAGREMITGADGVLIGEWTYGKTNIYAIFEIMTFELSFDTAGGTPAAIAPVRLKKDDIIADSVDEPSKYGYIFRGWEYNGVEVTKMPAGDVKVTAKWEAKKVNVRIFDFEPNGNNWNDNSGVIKLDFGTMLTHSNTPGQILYSTTAMRHYTFMGWARSEASARLIQTDHSFDGVTVSVTVDTEADLNLYQVYAPDSYSGIKIYHKLGDSASQGTFEDFPPTITLEYNVNLYDALSDYIAHFAAGYDFVEFQVKNSGGQFIKYYAGTDDLGYNEENGICNLRDLVYVSEYDYTAKVANGMEIRLIFQPKD